MGAKKEGAPRHAFDASVISRPLRLGRCFELPVLRYCEGLPPLESSLGLACIEHPPPPARDFRTGCGTARPWPKRCGARPAASCRRASSRVHGFTRSALALARLSSRRLRRAALLSSEFIEGTPHGSQCGSGSRLRYGHETRRSHGAPRHASSVRPPSRGAYLRAHARRSRLPSSSRSAFGSGAYSVWQ